MFEDKEFGAEPTHRYIDDAGGKSYAPLREKHAPLWRMRGVHRKWIKRHGLPKKYRFRVASEANNSAVKRRFSPVLRGKRFWQQARDLHGKYLAYNLSRDCYL